MAQMHTTRRLLFVAALINLLALCLCVDFVQAYNTKAGNVELEFFGSLNVRAEGDKIRQRERDTWDDKAKLFNVWVMNGKASTERHSINAQLRPYMTSTFDPDAENYSRVSVDELYWDGRATDNLTLTAGRKRIVNGVALGHNPTDFLKHTDREYSANLTDEERRGERRGDNLVGASYFFEDATLQGYLLLPNSVSGGENPRGLAQFSHRIQPLQADYSVSAYYEDGLNVGLNISATLAHSITAYVELALSEDRGRPVVVTNDRRFTGGGRVPPLTLGSYQDILNADSSPYKWEGNSNALKLDNYDGVIGVQYTHASGVGVNVEYWRSNTAYTRGEVNDILEGAATGLISPRDAERLLTRYDNMRREKVFVRVSDIPIVQDLTLEQTAIFGLTDSSLFLRSSFAWQISDATTFRLNANYFSGGRTSEYGMIPYEWQLFSSFKYLY